MEMMLITMESDALSDMKRDLDLLITKIIGSMRAWNSTEGAINLKLTIKLNEIMADDGAGGLRGMTVPVFEHKVSAVIQAKTELKGETPSEYELVWDAIAMRYGMVKVRSGQTSLFDEDEETGEDAGDLEEIGVVEA